MFHEKWLLMHFRKEYDRNSKILAMSSNSMVVLGAMVHHQATQAKVMDGPHFNLQAATLCKVAVRQARP